jgi:hypothetical protein
VGGVRAGAGLRDDTDGHADWDGDAFFLGVPHQQIERYSGNVLHGDKGLIVTQAKLMNLYNVGVMDICCKACFLHKHALEAFIIAVLGQYLFQDHHSLQPGFTGFETQINRGHPAYSELL